jgi:GNAT superfamily N-acetyltransferase
MALIQEDNPERTRGSVLPAQLRLPSMADVSWSALRDLDDRQRNAVRSIFEEAFPPWEREPFDDLVGRAAAGVATPVILVDSGQPVALAVTSRLGSARWSYLEYFAVAADRRDHGLGGQLWRAMARDLAVRDQPGRVVLEVEDPAEVPEGSPEIRQRERRIRFYERQGARLLPVRDYHVPRLDDVAGSYSMLLLWAAVAGDAEPPGPAELASLLPAVYAAGYGLQADHPLVLAALRGSNGG